MKKWFVIFSVAVMVTVFARVPAYPEEAQEETQGVSLPKKAEKLEIAKKITVLEAELEAAKRENAMKDAEISRLKEIDR